MKRSSPSRRTTALAFLGLLVGALGSAPAPARAEDAGRADALGKEVDALLAQVASDDFAVREAARKRLAVLAGPARSLLEARRKDPDPEVRRTVEALLTGIGVPDPLDVPVGDLGPLGLVTFSAEGTLADVLARWESDVGGRVRVLAEAARTPVKASFERRPYFEGLATILDAARVDLGDGFDETGSAISIPRDATAATPPVPAASVGPLRLEAESVLSDKSLRPGVRTKWTIKVRLLWAPFVQVLSFQSPTVVRAVDAAGRAIQSGANSSSTWGLGGGRRVSPSLPIEVDPADGAGSEQIAEIELRTRVRLRHGAQQVVFDDLSATALPATRTVPASARDQVGETRVTVEQFGPDPDHPGWAMAAVTAVLARGVSPDGVTASLETSDGTVRPLYDLSSRIAGSDGVLKMTVRAPNLQSDPKGQRLRVSWYAREVEAPVSFVLRNIPLR